MFIWDKKLGDFWYLERRHATKIRQNREKRKNSWHISRQMRGMEIQGLKTHLVPFGYGLRMEDFLKMDYKNFKRKTYIALKTKFVSSLRIVSMSPGDLQVAGCFNSYFVGGFL